MNSDKYAPRLAGLMYLLLMATIIGSVFLFQSTRSPDGISDTLINISEHPLRVRLSVLLLIIGSIETFVLAVMLFATLKGQDTNLAILALSFRLGEAILYAVLVISVLLLLFISQEYVGTSATDSTYLHTFGISLLRIKDLGFVILSIFFSVGSTLFCYLFFKSRSIPRWLSVWGMLGIAISIEEAINNI